MKIQRLAVALTVANLVLLLLTVTQAGSISRETSSLQLCERKCSSWWTTAVRFGRDSR